MKEQFLDYEHSKMMKELGFDEECFKVYVNDGMHGMMLSTPYPDHFYKYAIFAPLYQQVKEWLWEKKGVAIGHEWLSSFYYTIAEKGEIKKGGLTPHKSPITAEKEGINKAIEYLHSQLKTENT